VIVKQPTHNDQTIIRYLLNNLPQDDEARFEEVYLGDGDLFEQVRALEEELIEDYVKEHLSGRERQLFERHYLASEPRRARIETARQLVHVCSLRSTAWPTRGDRINGKFLSMGSWLWMLAKPQLSYVAGAALAIIVGLGSVVELLRQREQLALVNEERVALARRAEEAERQLVEEREQLAEERMQGSALRGELDDVNRRLGRMERELARSQRANNEIVLLTLVSGVRDINKPETAVISADTKFVDLRVTVEKPEATKPGPYRAIVKTVDEGKEIWRREGIKLRETISAQYVMVRVPADRFRAIDGRGFTVTLSAPSVGGKDYEELDICYFEVISR
jgi:hypothetical protein